MYVDKPMKSHSLMQAIAQVNRVFKDKRGGLVVDSARRVPGRSAKFTYET
jgi:type I restriction enzyme R subunit